MYVRCFRGFVVIIVHSMLILALDTTTRTGSSALVRADAGATVVVREAASDPAQAPAARLPADLMALLDHAGHPLDAIDLFAVATGPGSFTGLRIGIATMQGLAFATGKPLIGVSALDALAAVALLPTSHLPPPTFIATWVDAWRGEVYASTYVGGRASGEPIVALPADLLPELQAQLKRSPPDQSIAFIGDAAATYRDLIVAALGMRASIADPATPLLAGAIATLAYADAQRGELPPPDAIRPLYVRRPDVELVRERT
jgi:tRNA threonylcarbamoyladenosine biosynthesis protein TsaB